MVITSDDHLKRKMMRKGSVLKYLGGISPGGAGCAAGGGVLLFSGILLCIFMRAGEFDWLRSAIAGGVFMLPGLLLILLGVLLKSLKEKRYLGRYEKKSPLTREELLKVEEEFKNRSTVILIPDSKASGRVLQNAGFLTEHYFKAPGNSYYVRKIEDMVAFFYSDRIRCADGGFTSGLAALSRGDSEPVSLSGISDKTGRELVKAVTERHPSVIGANPFSYGGRTYDMWKECDEVKELHSLVVSGRMKTGE